MDRQCPNPECEFLFKVKLSDWLEKFSDELVYCPQCGQAAPSDKWFTESQVEVIQKVALSAAMGWIHDELKDVFKDLERKTRHDKYVRFSYKPGPRPQVLTLPILQSDEWETEHTCKSCSATFSIIGNIHFCPCCGKRLDVESFVDTLDAKERQIRSLDNIEQSLVNTLGTDGARKVCIQLMESTLIELVSGFQSFAEQLYLQKGGDNLKRNMFQRIPDGSGAFEVLLGVSYESLIHGKIPLMRVLFQRRHLLEHRNGIVDKEYLDKSGDTTFPIGTRIVIKSEELISYIDLIRTLSMGLVEASAEA